jgi:hypothetical protein
MSDVERFKHRFKKGQVVHLDSVYEILGIIPTDAYDQDDMAIPFEGNDCGESLRFTRNVEIIINIRTW